VYEYAPNFGQRSKKGEGGRRRTGEDEGGRRRTKEDEGGRRRRRMTEEEGEGGRRRTEAKDRGEGRKAKDGRRRMEDEGHRLWDYSLAIVGRNTKGMNPRQGQGLKGRDGETRTVLFQVDIQTEELQSKYRIYIRSERAEFPEREKQKD
jgi:hypothetical protein